VGGAPGPSKLMCVFQCVCFTVLRRHASQAHVQAASPPLCAALVFLFAEPDFTREIIAYLVLNKQIHDHATFPNQCNHSQMFRVFSHIH